MSMSQMCQKQMEKQSDFRCWIFNLFRMNLNSLDGQFASIWPNQWGLRKALPDQVSEDEHTFPITSSSVALVAFFSRYLHGSRCWVLLLVDRSRGWFTLAKGTCHLCGKWKEFELLWAVASIMRETLPDLLSFPVFSFLGCFTKGLEPARLYFSVWHSFSLRPAELYNSGPTFPTGTFLALGSSQSRILWLNEFHFADQSS